MDKEAVRKLINDRIDVLTSENYLIEEHTMAYKNNVARKDELYKVLNILSFVKS